MLRFVTGDATSLPDNSLLVHVVNDVGAWGAGFSGAVSRRWPHVEACYRGWATTHHTEPQVTFSLGNVMFVQAAPFIWIANLCAQHGIGRLLGKIPLQYDALGTCLEKAGGFALQRNLSVHMPRIGCGLAGGTWDKVESLVVAALVNQGLDVTVHDL